MTDTLQPMNKISVHGLTMNFGSFVVMKDLGFDIAEKDIFAIVGESGCGKSTLLRHLIGLIEPAKGSICYGGESFTAATESERMRFMGRFGVMYQSGALWSSMTLAENIAMPIEEMAGITSREALDLAYYKLALVGLSGFENHYPSQISGGMKKRAGIARAIALDPEIIFLDEPGAGLDPLSSQRLDELILKLRDTLGSTVVMVTHELASIFAIANNSVFLDVHTRTQGATGNPVWLRDHSENENVRLFYNRGKTGNPSDQHD